jgi:hypothetical protein
MHTLEQLQHQLEVMERQRYEALQQSALQPSDEQLSVDIVDSTAADSAVAEDQDYTAKGGLRQPENSDEEEHAAVSAAEEEEHAAVASEFSTFSTVTRECQVNEDGNTGRDRRDSANNASTSICEQADSYETGVTSKDDAGSQSVTNRIGGSHGDDDSDAVPKATDEHVCAATTTTAYVPQPQPPNNEEDRRSSSENKEENAIEQSNIVARSVVDHYGTGTMVSDCIENNIATAASSGSDTTGTAAAAISGGERRKKKNIFQKISK